MTDLVVQHLVVVQMLLRDRKASEVCSPVRAEPPENPDLVSQQSQPSDAVCSCCGHFEDSAL